MSASASQESKVQCRNTNKLLPVSMRSLSVHVRPASSAHMAIQCRATHFVQQHAGHHITIEHSPLETPLSVYNVVSATQCPRNVSMGSMLTEKAR